MTIEEMKLKTIIFDTETTGLAEPEIVEAAWLLLESPMTLLVLEKFEQRYKPSKTIELGAMATHNIMAEDLVDMPESSTFSLPSDIHFVVGHNVDYDWKAAGSPDVKRICTLALSRFLFPNLDSHSQSAMLYHLERGTARENLIQAHSALADVMNCRRVLGKLLDFVPGIETWEDLWQLSEKARIPSVMTFGKYKGIPIAGVPGDYKQWLLRQPDVDPYLRKALTISGDSNSSQGG